jgi:Arc-like DNA binding domain
MPKKSHDPPPVLSSDRFHVRLPQELRDALDAALLKSERSLNAEIVFRLRRDLANEGKLPAAVAEKVAAYKSDRLDLVLLEVVKGLPPDKQLALLQLLK